jgi:formate dehydrogenase major subunit
MKQAAKKGVTLIVMDPRRPPIANHAAHYVSFKPGTDVALFNAMINVIINEKLYDEEFIKHRTTGFDKLTEAASKYTPELAEKITAVPAETIRKISRLYGKADRAMIFWGMGISQHTHGTENARCLISLALITGNVGRPGTGLHPLRGQNNVQGSSDMGLIPMYYPGYQPVEDPEIQKKFEKAWGTSLEPNRGLTVVEIMSNVLEGKIKAMFMMGENPFLSDPNINKVKKALATMEFLVVQDIFMTETAEFADVILAASSFPEKDGTYTNTDRRVQLARRAIKTPGKARPDWEILIDLSNRMGYQMNYKSPSDVFEEMRQLTPGYAGITYERLQGPGGLVWPCTDEQHPGTPVLHSERFPAGNGKLIPAEFAPAKELPDTEYPFVLNTGRVLSHWHTGTMTRRAVALNAIEPEAFVEMNPIDMDRMKIQNAEKVSVKSRRGEITIKARVSTKVQPGNVFIPFHYKEAAANLLTIDSLDPVAKIPEFKFCAVRIDKISN